MTHTSENNLTAKYAPVTAAALACGRPGRSPAGGEASRPSAAQKEVSRGRCRRKWGGWDGHTCRHASGKLRQPLAPDVTCGRGSGRGGLRRVDKFTPAQGFSRLKSNGFGEQMGCDGRSNHLSRPPVPLGVWRFSIRCASGAADRRPSSGKAAVEGCLHSMRHIRNAAAQRMCGSYLQTCNGVPM